MDSTEYSLQCNAAVTARVLFPGLLLLPFFSKSLSFRIEALLIGILPPFGVILMIICKY